MTLLNDRQIIELATNGMIEPFVPYQVKEIEQGIPGVSYGTSAAGYDIRLSHKEFKVFKSIPGRVVNPKRFSPDHLEPMQLHADEDGQFFILPSNSYGLGVAMEAMNMPPDVTAIAIGKSTYARCGVIAALTPAEPAWRGYLTLEFSNSSKSDCRMYANEGVIQLLFFRHEPSLVNYAVRSGKYQGQPQQVVLAKV